MILADQMAMLLTTGIAAKLYPGTLPTHFLLAAACCLAPTTLLIFLSCGVYDVLYRLDLRRWCLRAFSGLAISVGVALTLAYAFKLTTQLPRLVIGPWVVLAGLGILLARLALWLVENRRAQSALRREQTVLIGNARECLRMAGSIDRDRESGLEVCAIVADGISSGPGEQTLAVYPRTGLALAVAQHHAQRVVVCGRLDDHDLVQDVLRQLLDRAITVQYAPDLSDQLLFGVRSGLVAGEPILNLTSSPLGEGACLIKWLEDKILSALILLLISPVMAGIALAIKLSSPGPVFFVQERHGLGGKVIRVYKFRSMHQPLPATAVQAASPSAGEQRSEDFVQARQGDARITPLGGFLRKTSLDELPQVINVLEGRDVHRRTATPPPQAQPLLLHPGRVPLMRRHYVKPGITGLAQVSGSRGETRSVDDMRRRVDLDLRYILDWSLGLDLKLIALTVMKGFLNRQP